MSWSTPHPAFNLLFLAIFTAVCNAQETTVYKPTIGTVFPSDNEVVWRTLSSTIHLLGTLIHSGWSFAPISCTAPCLFGIAIAASTSSRFLPLLLIGHSGVSILAYCIARRSDVPKSGMYHSACLWSRSELCYSIPRARPGFYAPRPMAFPSNLR